MNLSIAEASTNYHESLVKNLLFTALSKFKKVVRSPWSSSRALKENPPDNGESDEQF